VVAETEPAGAARLRVAPGGRAGDDRPVRADLQEPLRKVTSFCQMLQNRYAGTLDERADTYIEFAVDGARRMQQLAERIFVIFQRLHPRDRYEGTGIGLAMCRKIIEFHGGEVWLDSEYRGGARVLFTLPATSDTMPT
jgi:light-regulated signal transduction histidine kinase (bacteriophytochrome)